VSLLEVLVALTISPAVTLLPATHDRDHDQGGDTTPSPIATLMVGRTP